MTVFADPIFLRGMERLFLVAAAAYLGFLGYKLFLYGIASGRSAANPHSQVATALGSGVAPGLFFMFVAGAVVLVVSMTGNPSAATGRGRSTAAGATRGADRADLQKQIDLLKQAERVHQDLILGLRNQLVLARTNNAVTQEVVDQMQQSLNQEASSIDYNALYTQMTEMNDAITELQNENDALRQENATLRAQSSQSSPSNQQ